MAVQRGLKGYSIVIVWKSNKSTWRTSRYRVNAIDEKQAKNIGLDKLRKNKNYFKHIQISIL